MSGLCSVCAFTSLCEVFKEYGGRISLARCGHYFPNAMETKRIELTGDTV